MLFDAKIETCFYYNNKLHNQDWLNNIKAFLALDIDLKYQKV